MDNDRPYRLVIVFESRDGSDPWWMLAAFRSALEVIEPQNAALKESVPPGPAREHLEAQLLEVIGETLDKPGKIPLDEDARRQLDECGEDYWRERRAKLVGTERALTEMIRKWCKHGVQCLNEMVPKPGRSEKRGDRE